MIIYTFAATINFISRRATQCARYVSTRRAFFMLLSLFLGLNYNLLMAARSLNGTSDYPHFNFSPCDELIVGGKGGSRFLLLPINNQLIMSKSTNELQTVQITPAQAALLDFISHDSAKDIAYYLGTLTISACNADCPDLDSIEKAMALTHLAYAIALENKEMKANK